MIYWLVNVFRLILRLPYNVAMTPLFIVFIWWKFISDDMDDVDWDGYFDLWKIDPPICMW